MKKLYRITNKAGAILCFQVASNPRQAVEIAKVYGHRAACRAEYIQDY